MSTKFTGSGGYLTMNGETIPIVKFAARSFGSRFVIREFTDEELTASGRVLPETVIAELQRRIMRHYEGIAARTCTAGHVHDTYSGRVFCDYMRGYP
jgi:hypothetical protein